MPTTRLRQAARLYAQMGYHVFPLLEGSKEPAMTGGFHVATTNLEQIEKWWKHNPHYNIGIACGSSGIIVIDFDSYKNGIQTDSLFDDDDIANCVIVDTASGGTHVWFKQPAELKLTNARGDLPDGIDVRGFGGYVVAPPSHLRDGGTYTFVPDHKPTDVQGRTLPADLVQRLLPPRTPVRESQEDAPEAAEIRRALACIPDNPGYETWLSVLMAVHSVLPDDEGVALIEEWSPGYTGEVAKKFASFKRGGVGVGSLFHIARAYGYVSPQRSDVRQQLQGVQRWLGTAACVETIKERASTRVVVTPLISMLHVLVGYGIDRATHRIYISCRMLGNLLATSGQSAHRQLTRLQELGLLEIKESDHHSGSVIDIQPLLNVTHQYQVEGECHAEYHFHQEHVGDDAFATYPYTYAAKRRGAPLLPSLGATGLLLWPHLVHGGTVADLAETTGLSKATVKKACQRFVANSLVTTERVGKETYYALIVEAEARLDAVRPHMQTAWVGQMRVARNHSATADYAHLRLRQFRRSKLAVEPRTIAWWENLLSDSLARAEAIFDFLQEQGYDARCKVGKEKPIKRERSRYDFKEMWNSWGHRLYQEYAALRDLPHQDRVRRLTFANITPDLSKEQFAAAAKEMAEKVDLMLMMSHKVKRWVTAAVVEEAEPVQVAVKPQMVMDFA